MQTPTRSSCIQPSKRFFALSALAGAFATGMIGCGGGAAGTVGTIECGANELTKAGGGCTPAKLVDTNNDAVADGIDFNGDGIPEMVIVAGGPSTKGLDLNGDGTADYFLQTAGNQLRIFNSADASGSLVTVVVSPSGELIGLDSNGDRNSDDNRLGDKEAPTVMSTPNGGTLPSAPNVALECIDNVVCNAIAYTLDGSEPFTGAGSVLVAGRTANIQLSTNTTLTLKFRARDAAGNLSEIKTAAFTLGCPSVPVANAGPDIEVTANTGAEFDGSGSSTSIGTLVSYEWRQIPGGNAPTMNGGQPFTAVTPSFTAPSAVTTLRYQLEVTDSNNCKATDEVFAYVMVDKTRGVFVNADSGDDVTGNGTRAKPWATLNKGITDAASDTAHTKDVYVVSRANNANYVETTTLTVPAGVSLFGGFNSLWIRDTENNRTSVQGASTTVDVTVGTARNSFLAGFSIKAAPSSADSGKNSFAVKVHGTSTTGTSFTSRHNTLTAGNGGDGVTGAAVPGSSYGLYASTLQTVVVENSNVTSGKGGKGIAGTAGATGTPGIAGVTATTTAGVAGGVSPDPRIAIGGGPGGNGGAPLAGGAPGAAGLGNTGAIDGKGGIASLIGANGANGSDGTVGSSGASATVAGTGMGSSSATSVYQTANGNAGSNGGHGGGGGGGAGGGGGTLLLTSAGGPGGGAGGGGSGGIGSSGGSGGIGGGASFGLFVDKVKTLSVALQTTVTTNQGGNAGAGGLGGVSTTGGKGGDGAPGGVRAGRGGTGGKGGNGGSGGDGAGGGGGPSIGIYVGAQVEATLDNTVIITTGDGGAGGNTRNGAGGQGGNVFGVFDADPAATKPAVSNPAGITLGNGGTGGLKEAGGTGTVGTQGTAKTINW